MMLIGASTFGTLNWHLNLGVSSGTGQYKLPDGYENGDWVSFGNLKQVASEVIANHQLMMALKEQLENNTAGDFIMKIVGCSVLVAGTVFGLLYKMKGVRRAVSRDVENGNRAVIVRNPSYSQTGF